MVIGELLDGFAGGSKEAEKRRQLERFRRKPRTVTVPITEATAEWFTQIKQQLRRKGKPIPINDVWIAAVCMEHGAAILSADGHFAQIDGLLPFHAVTLRNTSSAVSRSVTPPTEPR